MTIPYKANASNNIACEIRCLENGGEEKIQTFLRSIELFSNCLMPEVSDMILCDFIMKYCTLYIIKFLFYSLLAKSSVKLFI